MIAQQFGHPPALADQRGQQVHSLVYRLSCKTALLIHCAYLHDPPHLVDEHQGQTSVLNSRCDRRMDTFGSLLGRAKEEASEHLLQHHRAYDQPGLVPNVSIAQAARWIRLADLEEGCW